MANRFDVLRDVLRSLQRLNVGLSELLSLVLVHGEFNDPTGPIMLDLVKNASSIMSCLYYNNLTGPATLSWAYQAVRMQIRRSIGELADADHGWNFNASHARPEQVVDFKIEDMMRDIQASAPDFWFFVNSLLSSDEMEAATPRAGGHASASTAATSQEEDEDSEYWDADVIGTLDGEEGIGGMPENDVQDAASDSKQAESRERLKQSLRSIKSVVIISILLHNRDQRCNLLQSTMGIFLHSCGAPEKLTKVLARMGISISITSVNRAINSLSEESGHGMEVLGRTLLPGVGFDNFDFKLEIGIPTVDSLRDTLFHMTSAIIFRLDHGVTPEHLRCSNILWDRSELNPLAKDPRPLNPHKTMLHLLSLHPEPEPTSDNELTRRGRFRSWLFRRTLINHGPPAFKHFAGQLHYPEAIEQIPIVKLHQVPLRAMDINQSKVSGNIEALTNILTQAGLGDPSRSARTHSGDPVEDISEFVTLINGDLGTYERILTARLRRRQEHTPFDRLQFVVFVPGLFHLKMAAADAIWRILVAPTNVRVDPTSFAKILAKLRPTDSSRLINNAKFRQQHDTIGHVGAILQLDAWRVEVTKRTGGKFKSLDEWAASKPSWCDVEEIADCLALEYVEGEIVDLHEMQYQSATTRDRVHENTMRTLNYLMLYEELAYAMNAGDIGHIETVLPSWIQLFRATGKHKYGNQMLRFIHALYFVYTDELRHAVRYNILVNPLGKAHHFRAVDWMVELLNLYIKVIYGGEGSNNTKQRILLESALVLIFRSCHSNIERNFKLPGLTYAHTTKNMRMTFKAILEDYVEELAPNETRSGRSTAYLIPDVLNRGGAIIEAEAGRRDQVLDSEVEDLSENMPMTAEDISTEGMI